MRSTPHVAVIGAGIQGSSIALELAARRCRATVFERESRPFTQASAVGEGKIHCGFLYANDTTFRTASLLASAALDFAPLVERWTGSQIPDSALSSSFTYAVHADSLVPAAEFAAHGRRVADLMAEASASRSSRYPIEDDRPWFEPVHPSKVADEYGDQIVAAFRTGERAIDPTSLAGLMTRSLMADDRITVSTEVAVERVKGDGRRFEVVSDTGETHGPFDHVVNAAWAGRLAIDASRGMVPGRPWLFRRKVGVTVDAGGLDLAAPESTTVVLGPFGDVVDRRDGRWYLSWYPACRVQTSSGLVAPGPPPPTGTAPIVEETLDELSFLIPRLSRLRGCRATADSGVIFTWGASDIDDPHSELHSRDEIGTRSDRGYHSVNTGKLTTAPRFAMQVADRIVPP